MEGVLALSQSHSSYVLANPLNTGCQETLILFYPPLTKEERSEVILGVLAVAIISSLFFGGHTQPSSADMTFLRHSDHVLI